MIFLSIFLGLLPVTQVLETPQPIVFLGFLSQPPLPESSLLYCSGWGCTHTSQRKRPLGILLCRSTLFPQEESQMEPGARLAASKPQSSSCLHPHSTGVAASQETTPGFLYGCWGSRLTPSCLCSKHSHSPTSPQPHSLPLE